MWWSVYEEVIKLSTKHETNITIFITTNHIFYLSILMMNIELQTQCNNKKLDSLWKK